MASQVTAFTPPANCASHWTYEPSATDGNDFSGGLLIQRAQGPPNAPSDALDPACWPDVGEAWGRWPGFTTVFTSASCPSGYTAALQSNGPTTTGTCCLNGFDYTSVIGTLNGGTDDVVFYGCTSMYSADYEPTSVFAITPYGSSGTLDGTLASVTVVSGPITMWAQPITVAYQERDIPITTTTTPSEARSTSTPGSSETTPPATVASLAATSSPTAAPATQKSQTLSSGAIAGVAIGAAALLSILAGILLLLRRRKSKTRNAAVTPSSFSSFMTPSSFSSKFEGYHDHSRAELETSPWQHGNARKSPAESRFELPTPHEARRQRDSPWAISD